LVNKIDAMAVFDFNKELAEERIHALNPSAEIFYVSSKTGEGYEAWINWLKNKVAEAKAN